MIPDPPGVWPDNSNDEVASNQVRQNHLNIENKNLEDTLRQLETEKAAASAVVAHDCTLSEKTQSVYFTLNAGGFIRSVNQFGAACLGYTVAELIDRPIFSIFHPEDRHRLQAFGIGFSHSSTPDQRGEFRLVCKDGKVLWVEEIFVLRGHANSEDAEAFAQINFPSDRVVLILDEENGQVQPAASHTTDEEFRATFEQAGVGIAHIAPDGRFVRVNQRLCDIVGFTREELQSQTCQNLTHPDDRVADREDLVALLAGEIQTYSREKRFIRKNGSPVWINFTASLVRENKSKFSSFNTEFVLNSLSEQKYLIAVIEEIAERKRAEAEIQESASAWLTVIETVGEGLTLSDAQGRFEVFNSKMQEITGYSKEEVKNYPDFTALLYPDPQEQSDALAGVQELLHTGGFRDIETTIKTKSGLQKTLLVSTSIVKYKDRKLFLSAYRDITERKQMENAICIAEEKYRSIFENAIEGIFQTTADGRFLSANPALAQIYGYGTPAQLISQVTDIANQLYVHPNQRSEFIAIMQEQEFVSAFESQIYRADGSVIWISENARVVKDPRGNLLYYEGTIENITARKQAHEALQLQAEREQLMAAMSQRIRQSLNLREILSTTVEEVRQFLATDRVLIYRFNPDGSGVVEVESRDSHWLPMQGVFIDTLCFPQHCIELYQQGRIGTMEDIDSVNLTACHLNFLLQYQVKANLVVPILVNEDLRMTNQEKVLHSQFLNQNSRLWGLLVAHHCREHRRWNPQESDLLKQLSIQVGIAIKQSELYQQLHRVNADLERQVQERTTQLRQALDFEAMLKRITDKVRDSLDEAQILKTAVWELALVLGVERCDTALYNIEQTTATICYEYAIGMPDFQEKVVQMADFPEVYKQLLQGQHFQFCALAKFLKTTMSELAEHQQVILACPIVDDQGVLGDLWLFNQQNYVFSELEIRLVQQVANQCAIAIRQARLYQASQAQIEELQKLSWLKDEFLSTVSHELRTPLSNMKMAIQMLAIALNQKQAFFSELAKPEAEKSKVARYFNILQTECEREISLINDLLDLQRLEATAQPWFSEMIDLKDWLPMLVKPFYGRATEHGQILQLDICENVSPVMSDSISLGRIVTELLNNACKYTPAGEKIIVKAGAEAEMIQLSVTNTGTEIPANELPRIFEKFYRIPRTDRWQQGGTGLGLTLVKKLVTHLGGSIEVKSAAGQTCFKVEFPSTDPATPPA